MPEARKREPVVPAKVKIVVKELLDQRVYDLAAAAAKAGLTTYLARRYLKRPNVLRYFREERAAALGADHSHGVEQCVAAMCSDAHSDRSHWRIFHERRLARPHGCADVRARGWRARNVGLSDISADGRMVKS
jgi:hypothetical protein